MAFTLPPPKNKKTASQQSAYRAYINSHPSLKPYAQTIYRAAGNYGVDPVYYASLVNFESGGNPNAKSGANAVGLAQIHVPSWVGKADPRDGHTITMSDVHNPTWNLNFGAFLFSRATDKYGSPDAAYRQGYNPGYKGTGPFRDLPKGYVPTGTSQSPQQSAQRSVETGTAKQNLTDPYVTIKGGRLVKTDQAHAMKVFGQSLRRSQFMNAWQGWNDVYLAYTGKPVSAKQAHSIIAQGLSKYQVINRLTKGPNFQNSPVWKQNAPGYEGVWKSVYGQNSNPDQNAIRYAIVNNLGGDGFAQTLRQRPDYETSAEFKSNEASLSGVYTKIFSLPDQAGTQVIRAATRQGQTPDMFATYLRAQPEYQQSAEFKSRALGFAQSLGLVTGQQPTLNEGLVGGQPVGSQPNPNPNAKPAGVLSNAR